MKANHFTGLLSAIASVVFILFSIHFIPLDVAWDEITSFWRYSITDLHNTVTNYRAPNNHIGFNVFQNFLGRIIGVDDLYGAIEQVFWFRLAQGILSVFTLYFIFKFANKFGNRTTANIALIMAITTIPFFVYSTQLRGYNFSMLYAICLLYYTWSYYQSPKLKYFFAIIGCTFLLFYTIPSNAYFILPLGFVWSIHWVYVTYQTIRFQKKRDSKEAIDSLKIFRLLFALGIGCLLTFLAFSPIIEQILHNKWVDRVPANRFFVLQEMLPKLTDYFFSGRYLLVPLFLIGALFLIKKQPLLGQKWIKLVGIYLLAFIVSFARNDLPFERTFAVLFPVFVLIISIPISALITHLKRQESIQFGVLALSLYALFTVHTEFHQIQSTLRNNLSIGKRNFGNYQNFFQSDLYNPNESAKSLSVHYHKDPHPVLLMAHELDMITQGQYLRLYGMESYLFLKYKKKKAKRQAKSISLKPNQQQATIRYTSGDKTKPVRKYLPHTFTKKKYPRSVRKLAVTLDYVEQHAPSDKYYLINSYDHRFLKVVKPYLEKTFHVEKLSKGVKSYNVYLLTKKLFKKNLSNDRTKR